MHLALKPLITVFVVLLSCTCTFSQVFPSPVLAKTFGNYGADDAGYGICTDNMGNMYVTGKFTGMVDFDPGSGVYNLIADSVKDPYSSNNAFIAKYTKDGTLLWAFGLGGDYTDAGYDIKVGADNMLYVTGSFAGSNVDFDPSAGVYNLSSPPFPGGFIAKFDGSKTPGDVSFFQWAFSFGSAVLGTAFHLALDNKGMVYVTGGFTDIADFDPSLNNYNIGTAGNLGEKAFCAKYDGTKTPAGTNFFQWAFAIGAGETAKGYGICADANGNVYISGSFDGQNDDFDPSSNQYTLNGSSGAGFVAKYDGTKSPVDIDFFRFAFQVGYDNNVCRDIATDKNGNIYVTGKFNNMVDLDPGADSYYLSAYGYDVFIAKYDGTKNPSDTGFIQWGFNIGGSGDDEPFKLLVDKNDMLFITGYLSSGSSYNVDFDPGPSKSNTPHFYDDIFMAKYDVGKKPGDAAFLKWAFTTFNSETSCFSVDNDGYVYMSGNFLSNQVDFDPSANKHEMNGILTDMFISKYNGNITIADTNFYQWSYTIGSGGQTATVRKVVADRFGNMYAIGTFDGRITFTNSTNTFTITSWGGNDIFVVKYKSDGDVVWAFSLGSEDAYNYGNDIVVDDKGMIYIAGTIYGESVDFDPGANTHMLQLDDPQKSMFIAKYDGAKLPGDSGFYQWAVSTGGHLDYFDKGNTITVDSNGILYVAARFFYDIDADPGPNAAILTNSGTADEYVASYDGSKSPSDAAFYRWAFKIDHCNFKNIMATADGSLYVMGLTYPEADIDPTSGNHAINGNFVAKYDGTKPVNDGSFFKWGFKIPDGAAVENYFIDSKNALYVTGQLMRGYDCDFDPSVKNDTLKVTGNNNNYFLLAKYDLNKNPDDTTFYQWAFDIGTDNYFGTAFTGKDIATDSTGLVYVLGTSRGAPYTLDIDPGPLDNFVAFSPNNTESFVFTYDGTQKPGDAGYCLGGFTLGGGSTQNDVTAGSIFMDATGNFLIGGSFKSKYTDIDPTSGNLGLTSICKGAATDAFIAKYAPFYSTPLRSLKFTGRQDGDKIKLEWQTMAEITTAYFDVEWSAGDTTAFKKISTVNAIGNGDNAYQYFHSNPSKGKNFYRLKIIAKDGAFTYSAILEVSYNQFELLTFSAAQENDNIQLKWETRTEYNTSVFEIEWSAGDTLLFKKIGALNATGTGNNAYQYLHSNPSTGKNFYRLKIINKDGAFVYSAIAEASITLEGNLVINIGPNPVNTVLNIYIAHNQSITGQLEIIDAQGRLIYSKSIEIPAGASVQHVNTSSLESGLYFLRITTADTKVLIKFIK